MKFHKLLIAMLVLSLTLGAKISVFAQDEEKPEMTEEEWQKQMDEYTAKKNELTGKLDQLTKDVDALKKTNSDKDAAVTKAEEDLYASVGSTKSGVADFRKKFEATEKTINSKNGKKEDAEKMFAEIEASKIKCLPEFYDRYKKMKANLEAWGPEVKKEAGYTVVKGDCLYKIAGKKEIYNNVKMWPVLWDANEKGVVNAPPKVSKTIKNPNLIYPGQVLRVPALTKDLEKKALEKGKKYRYTRKKKMNKEEATDKKKDEKKDVKKDEKKDVKKDTKKDVKKDEKKDVKKDVKKEEPKKDEKKK
jgi:nucleoid-associated protein YgaU